MRKNIISILTLASLLTLSSCGNDVPINSETSSNNQTTASSNNGNSNNTPSDDPVLPDIDSDKFDVIFDNNTTTLDKITVIDKENANKGVSLTINGVKKSVGTLSNDGKLELTWTEAPLDKSTITFSIDGTENTKTINKLSPTMMNALQRSYGFQNAFASTYDELVLQVIYCAENGNRYKTGSEIYIGDKGYNVGSSLLNKAIICYSPEIVDTNILSMIEDLKGSTVNQKFINALMNEVNSGTPFYSTIVDSNPSLFDSNTRLIGLEDGLKSTKDTSASPSTTISNKPSFAGFKPYYGNGVSSLPIDNYPTVDHVNTGFAVYYYTSLGYRPICESNSSAYKVYNNARNVLLNILDDSMSEYQKVLAIHDWITFRGTYNNVDINNGYNQYIDGLLKEEDYNLTVCNGYALTFSTLCAMSGIDAKYIMGYAGGGGHAWNEVKVDGKWYCVDTTWDKALMNSYQVENHEHFLISWDKLNSLTDRGRVKTATYSYPTSSIATNGNYPYYQSQSYTYNNQNYSRYISNDAEVTTAINYLKNRVSNFKSTQSVKATLTGYTTFTTNRAIEEFGFKNADIFNSFKSKLNFISYSNSENYDSYSIYIIAN